MTTVANNLLSIKDQLPPQVTLVAVSKSHPVENIQEAYQAGQRIFGENKVQELCQKYEVLPPDIEWHFIGHLQTNKVKYIAPFVSLIHSLDRISLLDVLQKEGVKNNRVLKCLVEVRIAKEESKHGFTFQESREFFEYYFRQNFSNVKILGLMGMSTFTEDKVIVSDEFKALSLFFNEIKEKYFVNDVDFKYLSMGMSDDYHLAIGLGSNMVRIGSLIFGLRNK